MTTTATMTDNMQNINKIKLELPTKFNGNDTSYELDTYYKKLRLYACMHNQNYVRIFEHFKNEKGQRTMITTGDYEDFDAELGRTLGRAPPPRTAEHMSMELYYILYNSLEPPARNILDDVEDDNGFESLRRLIERYRKPNLMTVVNYLQKNHESGV